MNSVRTAELMLILTCAVILGGCDRDERSRGPLRSENREVAPFDSIDMQGAARLEIAIGPPESLQLEGRQAVIERVQTDVRGSTLYIESKPRDWFMSKAGRRIVVKISLPHLQSLQLEGGNDVRLSGFSGGDSTIRAAGAAHIKATGRLDQLTVHMAGAGHADLGGLIADDAKVTVDGVGNVIVHPKDTLEATMNGVGAIFYTSRPREVSTRMNGLGTISRRDAKDIMESGAGEDAGARDEAPDPQTLQPEYEEPRRKSPAATSETDVI